jgi:hypothetical protein
MSGKQLNPKWNIQKKYQVMFLPLNNFLAEIDDLAQLEKQI